MFKCMSESWCVCVAVRFVFLCFRVIVMMMMMIMVMTDECVFVYESVSVYVMCVWFVL